MKIGKIIFNCIYAIILLCVLYNVIFSINTTITQNDYLKLLGISFFNMESELMQNDLNKGDLVVVKEAKQEKIQQGDIIAYTVNGKTRINKIINQQDGYTTKSNKNYYPDIEKISYNQVIGKVLINIPFWGFIITILQSKITTAIMLLFLVMYSIYSRYIYTKKQERAMKKKMNFSK